MEWSVDLQVYNEATEFVAFCAVRVTQVLLVANLVAVLVNPRIRLFGELSMICLFLIFFGSVGSLFYNLLIGTAWSSSA
ncbi:unnamed protein product [Arabis nemorensis]|uniref:Uncharacterized protein n=1 Tax=Arabis nemorensis TaxID=586526 RepID=A0A565C9R8_9BRAS|nr:unnamed protein product [Arabis nemorensis]